MPLVNYSPGGVHTHIHIKVVSRNQMRAGHTRTFGLKIIIKLHIFIWFLQIFDESQKFCGQIRMFWAMAFLSTFNESFPYMKFFFSVNFCHLRLCHKTF